MLHTDGLACLPDLQQAQNKSEGDLVEIYLITGPTGKRYVGQAGCRDKHGRPRGAAKRWREHCASSKHSSTYISRAIQKHGQLAFAFELLATVPREKADGSERFGIVAYNSLVPHGYNVDVGGRPANRPEHPERFKGKKSSALPVHIYLAQGKKTMGYECHVPCKPRRAFTKETMTMDEKLAAAVEYKSAVTEGKSVDVHRKYDLPPHVYHDKGRSGEGYRVAKPGCKKRSYTSASMSMETKCELALKYLDALKEHDKD